MDDETLGCGAILAAKFHAGAEIHIAAVSDGSRSHSRFMESSQLSHTRKSELVSAVEILGGHKDDIIFMDYEDEKLQSHLSDIENRIKRLLEDLKPRQIFIPHRNEPPLDHRAVCYAAQSALKQYKQVIEVYEYPVWLWCHWPWIHSTQCMTRKNVLRWTYENMAGWKTVKRLNCLFKTGRWSVKKEQALQCHKSQMERYNGNPDWSILSDIANGDFLKCLMRSNEFFLHWELRP